MQPGSHPRGFPEQLRSIVNKYQPKQIHLDLRYAIYLREFVQTTVILPPGVGNPGSVLLAVARFRWICWRIPGGPKIDDSAMNLAHLAGKWGPIFRETVEKPKENQGFRVQPLQKPKEN